MSLPSDAVSGASLDVVLSSPEAPIVAPAPAEPERIASPQPSDASEHITGDEEEQRSIGIATAGGGDREALILKAGGVNEASQVLRAQSRPSSTSELPTVVNSSSSDSVKVLFDGSSANAGGSTSTNAGPETSESVRPPVFRGALPLNRHANEGNSIPVHRTNAGFLPQSQVIGGNRHRFNSDNGRYRNQLPRVLDTNPHVWMPMPRLQGHGQPFMAPYAFVPHQAAPPFASPIGYTDGTSPYYGTPPAVLQTYYASQPPVLETYYVRPSPPPPPPYPMPHVFDKQLVLKKQIEYYFSVDNLCKDVFLRRNMDAQGWVPISLIATFRRVQIVTSNTNYILSALRSSTVIEIQRESIRRRNDWERWVLPSTTDRDGQASGSSAYIQ